VKRAASRITSNLFSVTLSVSDSKVTHKSVQNTVFEHIGAGASTSRSHHKDLDFDALV
jgi:hypothetical protein